MLGSDVLTGVAVDFCLAQFQMVGKENSLTPIELMDKINNEDQEILVAIAKKVVRFYAYYGEGTGTNNTENSGK